MIIAAVTHEGGWREHVVVRGAGILVGRWRGSDSPAQPDVVVDVDDRLVDDDAMIGDATIVFERYEDPVEATLIEACKRDDDASRLVYADWLDDRGHADRAELLRAQIEILRRPPGDASHAALANRMLELAEAIPFGWYSHVDRPVARLGDPAKYAFHIGLPIRHVCRQVKIFAGGVELTVVDDMPHVGQFAYAVECDIERVRRAWPLPLLAESLEQNHRHVDSLEEGRDRYRWMYWGPTTDNVAAFVFRSDDPDETIFTFWFHRSSDPRSGRVFAVRIPTETLVDVMQELVDVLAA